MRYARELLIAILVAGTSLTAFTAPRPLTPIGTFGMPDAVVHGYDPSDGNVWVIGNNVSMTSFQLESASSAFMPENTDPHFCVGPFDVCTKSTMFTLKTGGVTERVLGRVLPPGLSRDAIITDVLIDGSLSPSGTLPMLQVVALTIYLPQSRLRSCGWPSGCWPCCNDGN